MKLMFAAPMRESNMARRADDRLIVNGAAVLAIVMCLLNVWIAFQLVRREPRGFGVSGRSPGSSS